MGQKKSRSELCIGVCAKGNDSFAEVFCFKGSREEIREQTVKEALSLVLKTLV